MFGMTFPPGVDVVRLMALSGRRGKPPCIWEGPAATDQSAVETEVSCDPRVRQWLQRNHLIRDGIATLSLQVECYSQGKLVDRVEAREVTILLGERRRRKTVGEEVTLRAFDLAEHVLGEYKELLAERDTVIGRLVERALRQSERPPPTAAQPEEKPDQLEDILGKGMKFLSLAQGIKSLRDKN